MQFRMQFNIGKQLTENSQAGTGGKLEAGTRDRGGNLSSKQELAVLVWSRWSALVPRKINVLVCRIARDRIPTMLNLRDKGIDLDSCLCPVCDLVGESVVHLFAGCTLLSPIWSMIVSWWGVALPSEVTIRSLMEWGDNSGLEMESKRHLEAVIMVVFWSLWRFRNALVFGVVKPRKYELFDDIQTMS
ncbi:hypothetical protein LXL04_027292 [Taraxacum kok-saghyz]